MIKLIKKRDGSTEEFNPDKLNKWAEWASEINVTMDVLHPNFKEP